MADIAALEAAARLVEVQTEKTRTENEKLRTAQSFALLIALGLIFVALYVGLYNDGGKFLASLRETEMSRGLITFLVAVTTVCIALVLATYAMASNESAAQLKERFSYAKDVLGNLVGILGTILGFYFGTTVSTQAEAMALADPQFKAGQLITHVAGGTLPYRYTIVFPGEDPTKSQTKTSKDGWIVEQLPATLKPGDSLMIEATDAKDRKVSRALKAAPEIGSFEPTGAGTKPGQPVARLSAKTATQSRHSPSPAAGAVR